MKNLSKYVTGLTLIMIAGCAQTNQVDPVTTSSIDPVTTGSIDPVTTGSINPNGSTANNAARNVNPSPLIASPAQQLGSKVTPLGEGKARIVVTTLNSVNIRDKHACELGRFAKSRNATSVLTPLQTPVKTDIEGAQTYRIVDQEFTYYSADVPAPTGATSTDSLLKRCRA